MCFIDDSGRWLLHSKTVVKYKNKGIDVNKNYLRTQGELLHNSQEMNDVELARAVVQAAQHSHGTKRLNRQLAGGGVFADAPEFKVTVIAAVCFAMAGVFFDAGASFINSSKWRIFRSVFRQFYKYQGSGWNSLHHKRF